MGFTIGMPSLKLSNVVKDTKHAGLFRKVVAEALKERQGKDKDIDKNLTSENKYFGIDSAEKLIKHSEDFIQQKNDEIEEHNQMQGVCKRRKIRTDAVVMCALIIKPPAELMQQLSDEEQDGLLEDALEKVKEIVGEENVLSAVIHKDELVRHMHIFWHPVTEDGRLYAKEMHNQKFLRRLNQEMPQYLREKGWKMIDDCKAYDAGSQEQKENKRRSGKTSKVYKYEMDSLTQELAAEKEQTQESFRDWIKKDKTMTKLLERVEKLLIDVNNLKQEVQEEANQIILQTQEEMHQYVHKHFFSIK